MGLGRRVWVGVPVQGGDELGHLLIALDPAERALGVEHPGGGSAQHHVAVAPAGDVTVRRSGDADHGLDGVLGDQRLGEPPVDPEAADGEHLLQALAERVRGTGVGLSSRLARCLALRRPSSGSGWLKAFTSFASTHAFSLSGR